MEDNGRVVYASMLRTTITDVDWQVVKRAYKFARNNVKIHR